MTPRRQVRRTDVRPTYSRRQATSPRRSVPRPALPQLNKVRLLLPVIAIGIVLYLLGRLTAITHIQVKGEHQLTAAHITELTQTSLRHQWFGHNLILVNAGAAASSLKTLDPAIKQASVGRHGLHTLVVTVQERQPSLNWKTSGASYLLDANATVIATTPAQYAALPTVTDSSNLPVKVGEQVAPSSFVAFCQGLVQQLPGVGYPVTAMTVPTTTTEIYVQTKGGLVLKFDTTRAVGDEISDLQQVTTQLTSAHQAATQYIDLRIEHKAYYQ